MDQKHSPEATDQVSDRRRKLLKAAAAGAPLIATLQSGAAFAQASARNCIAKNATETPSKVVSSTDVWVRREVVRYKFRKNNGRLTNWKYDIEGIHQDDQDVGPYYVNKDGDGDGMGNTWTNTKKLPVAKRQTRYVLVYYQPSSDQTTATEKGPFPKFLDNYGDGLTGLTGSCLCSVDPNQPICPIP